MSFAPKMSTWPDEGATRPAATLSKVDLPQPVGPTIATNSPSATASEVESTARKVPPSPTRKLTATSESATAGAPGRAAIPALALVTQTALVPHEARYEGGVAELEE